MVRSYPHDVRNIEHCILPVFSSHHAPANPGTREIGIRSPAPPGPTTARRVTEPLYQEAEAGEVHQMMQPRCE
jgi:hypothetical protein